MAHEGGGVVLLLEQGIPGSGVDRVGVGNDPGEIISHILF